MFARDNNNIDFDWGKKFEIEMAEIKYYFQKYSSMEDTPAQKQSQSTEDNIKRANFQRGNGDRLVPRVQGKDHAHLGFQTNEYSNEQFPFVSPSCL